MEGRCIGTPIHGPDGRMVEALSISSPVFAPAWLRYAHWRPFSAAEQDPMCMRRSADVF